MNKIHERIKYARIGLHLSRTYVAEFLGVSENIITEIESGKRTISSDLITKLNDLFQIDLESTKRSLIGNVNFEEEIALEDQQEIENLLEYRERMKRLKYGNKHL